MNTIFSKLKHKVRGHERRDTFVQTQLTKLSAGGLLLDAGCGSQRYRKYCDHLAYRSQDFGQYVVDDKKMLGSEGAGGEEGYQYGPLDYVGDVWKIDERDNTFDAILCTEVFEHIPYPIATITEFSRLLKPGGQLIITVPGISLRHFDPYYFYSGFSDRWFERVLPENGLTLQNLENDGDYYSFMSVEIKRMFHNAGIFGKALTLPALAYALSKPRTTRSAETVSEGVYVVAQKQ